MGSFGQAQFRTRAERRKITGHLIIGTHATRIGLEHFLNEFCKSCGDEEEDKTLLHLLCTCPVLDRRRKRHLGAYYMEDFDELSCIDIGSLSCLIGTSEWFVE